MSIFSQNKYVRINIIVFSILIIVTILLLLIFKYKVEGEKNLPFKITKLAIINSAQGLSTAGSSNKWDLNLIQTNDIYLSIEKDDSYKKDISIASLTFENFKVIKSPNVGSIKKYRPTTNTVLYNYSPEYEFGDSLTYNGALSTNLAALEINNQGGLLSFNISISDLGNYISNEDTQIVHNGTLLEKAGVSLDDILFKISFDLVIKTNNNYSYKSTITLDLPSDDIIETGTNSYEYTNLDDIVFKRF